MIAYYIIYIIYVDILICILHNMYNICRCTHICIYIYICKQKTVFSAGKKKNFVICRKMDGTGYNVK
jgi:hypothetical protein